MGSKTDLLQIVGTTHPVGRFPDLLHGRNQKANQNSDNRNDDKQFN